MARTKAKHQPKAEPVPPFFSTCCEVATVSEAIRKNDSTSGVDDEPWLMQGQDGKWYGPVLACPWCKTQLG